MVRRRAEPVTGPRRRGGGLRDGWANFCAYLLQFLSGDAEKAPVLRAMCPVTSHFCASLVEFLRDDAQKGAILRAM